MEGVLGSPALFHSTHTMGLGPYYDSDNCSTPRSQNVTWKGWHERSSNEGGRRFRDLQQPWPARFCKLPMLRTLQRRDGTKGVRRKGSKKGVKEGMATPIQKYT